MSILKRIPSDLLAECIGFVGPRTYLPLTAKWGNTEAQISTIGGAFHIKFIQQEFCGHGNVPYVVITRPHSLCLPDMDTLARYLVEEAGAGEGGGWLTLDFHDPIQMQKALLSRAVWCCIVTDLAASDPCVGAREEVRRMLGYINKIFV